MKIINIYNDPTSALNSNTDLVPLNEIGLTEARQIAENLTNTLKPLMPAAGLAAPQIGIKKRIMIFSWNRTLDTLEVAINPSYKSIGNSSIPGWEACFSTAPTEGPCQATYLKRYNKILATYCDLDGKKVEKIMEGFAAKVFQHECDHLDGMVNVQKDNSEIKVFDTHEAFVTFMNEVKQGDSTSYIKPVEHKS